MPQMRMGTPLKSIEEEDLIHFKPLNFKNGRTLQINSVQHKNALDDLWEQEKQREENTTNNNMEEES